MERAARGYGVAFFLAVASAVLAQAAWGWAAPAGSARQAEVTPVMSGLDTVWDLVWGPDRRLYLTERPGRIRVWDGKAVQTLARLPVWEQGEAGLMGLALDPGFPRIPYVYVCYTRRDGEIANRVERLRLEGDRLVSDRVLLDGMAAASIHDGCRLRFDRTGELLVTMGDAAVPGRAQDPSSLNGKVLRIRADGAVPSDNPFPGSPVFTLGHRNPQGLALRPGTGEIYLSEHGPDTDDEINRLVPGANYGWPEIRGTREAPGFEPALWAWTPTIAPAAIAFSDSRTLFLATLKEGRLHRLQLDADGRIVSDRVVLEGYGRLRALAVGPDGCLYVGTSNRDGRGSPGPDDDRVLKVCGL
ncbi:MAG: PQQ-dependent sugar dehydrogenase [Limnochordaceae bacterium]|nr:PQQ-dependent sugar dehydrogenase [Limnochordaceae bacterium]